LTQVLIIHCGIGQKRIKRPTVQVPPARKEDRTGQRNNKEKADVFAEHLERTFRPNKEKKLG